MQTYPNVLSRPLLKAPERNKPLWILISGISNTSSRVRLRKPWECLYPLFDYVEITANSLSCRCLQSVKWDDTPHISLKNFIQSSDLDSLRLLGQFSHTSFLQCLLRIWNVTRPWVLCNVNIKSSHKEHSYVNQLFCQFNCFVLHKHRNYSHILQHEYCWFSDFLFLSSTLLTAVFFLSHFSRV